MRNYIYVPEKLNDKSWRVMLENWFIDEQGNWDYKVVPPEEESDSYESFLDCLDKCTELNKGK